MGDLVGHQKQREYLRQEIAQDRVKPAYLFTGPEKVGKFTLVRQFAKMLQCPGRGCNNCATCHQIDQGIQPDTFFLEDEGESFKVEEIREINRKTNLTFDSPYLVIAIENIERMTEESANAFLKTLEEPPPRVIFLLTTSKSQKILPTILSRVFTVELGGVSAQELTHYLRQQFPQVSEDMFAKVMLVSWNKPGLAIALLHNPERLERRLELYRKAAYLLQQAPLSERLRFIEEIHQQTKNNPLQLKYLIQEMLEIWAYLLRATFFATMQQNDFSRLGELTEQLELVQRSLVQIENNINKKLVLEYLMLKI